MSGSSNQESPAFRPGSVKKLIELTETQYAKLMADKRRLDALDAVLAEHASSAPWGWRWSPCSREDMPRLHFSQDGKLRSAREALDVLANNQDERLGPTT